METVSEMDLVDVLKSIKRETRPVEGHTDPGAIEDCWNEVFETLEAESASDKQGRWSKALDIVEEVKGDIEGLNPETLGVSEKNHLNNAQFHVEKAIKNLNVALNYFAKIKK